MRLKTRFMKVYKLFRLKKYGEPIGPVIEFKKPLVKILSPKKNKSLLNVVNEEEHSDHESDQDEI